MHIRFWGTRGSLAKPGRETVRYGGNTACVEVRPSDGTLIVLDCGTGAHDLGQALMASARGPIHGHLLVTHTHWDHIQGFPFFAPLFVRGNTWDVYAPRGLGRRLEETLAGQMEYTYFPVTLAQLEAELRYHEITEDSFDLGPVRVTTRFLNHPALALGYRLEADGVTMVYATDHEPHALTRGDEGVPDLWPVHHEDQRHVGFLTGADLVIHDAQYTLDEYAGKVGWGHSPAERVVDYALAAGVRRLALFHHDPGRTDAALDRLVATCRERVAGAGRSLDVLGAAEGQTIELVAGAETPASALAAPGAARSAPTDGTPTVLIVDDDPDVVSLLVSALRSEGFRLLTAADGDHALAMARAERPDLLLLDWKMPGRDGLAVCRTLREDADSRLRSVPVLLITGQDSPEDTQAGFAAGVTDYVTKPFRPAHLRARVHAWLLRSGRSPHPGSS